MSKIIEYRTIVHAQFLDLDKDINFFLEKDWYLYGTPYSINHQDKKGLFKGAFCQAIVKYEENV